MSGLLVEAVRGGRAESVHRGSIAVVDASGRLLYKAGHPDDSFYARSCLKPVQALPVILSGTADTLGLTGREVAVCCASHNGEPFHTEAVKSMLAKGGLTPEQLGCGAHPPYREETYEKLMRKGQKPAPIHNNCSGKHAGLLLAASRAGLDLASYLERDHPLQREIAGYLSAMAGTRQEDIPWGVDGCGLPTYSLPLRQLALVFARIADPSRLEPRLAGAILRLADAMVEHPEMVGGTDEFDTVLMQTAGGSIIGKAGAEGMYGIALRNEGIGIAIKVDDGNRRAAYPAAVEVIRQLGALPADRLEALERFRKPAIHNNKGDVVGEIRPVFKLSPGQA
ncbi:L-asparaginase [Paenibacillus sp. PK3_47]|uniref:asparaginase n=1 Tax=Paenibacillus sp. PK3_47 TaxID=2072642 RepID=UPI00201DF337|nr:asparaginase [Paenibacillus sp. PK3_47]UQZ35578.1 L-asparaginase [Paenibacillus sp. PK3_47]